MKLLTPFLIFLLFVVACGDDTSGQTGDQSTDDAGAESPCIQGQNSCPEGKYCHTDDGLCGALGHCRSIPTVCSNDEAEVCGCDGQFHGGPSTCAAQWNGTVRAPNLAHCIDDHCPSDDDPDVTYYAFTDTLCSRFRPDINCPEDQAPFDDDCGCGCILQ